MAKTMGISTSGYLTLERWIHSSSNKRYSIVGWVLFAKELPSEEKTEGSRFNT